MSIFADGKWFDLIVIVFVFAIILLKVVIFIWYKSKRDKKKIK